MRLTWLILGVLVFSLCYNVNAGKRDSDNNNNDVNEKKEVVFIPRERASIFLSYNECIRRMNCGVTRKEECSEECADGNTEEEMEEYTEMFEHIDEYRGNSKKTKNKKHESPSSSSDDDDDDDSTTTDNESDASSEAESEPKPKSTKKK